MSCSYLLLEFCFAPADLDLGPRLGLICLDSTSSTAARLAVVGVLEVVGLRLEALET